MDESGMCVEQLQKTDANLAYVTPAHQYPTGVIMPIGRRSQLLGRAEKRSRSLYYREMIMTASSDIMENQSPAMQGLDDGENVIDMGTFSKAIAPAIRASLYGALQRNLQRDISRPAEHLPVQSRIDQKVLTLFLTEGHF